jgi:hypothetical protein
VHHLNVVRVVCFSKKALDTIFSHVFFLKYKEKSTGHTDGTRHLGVKIIFPLCQ